VTPAQLVALSHPCLLGGETAHPRYGWRLVDGFTLVLTVNRGYE
jgi:hypothetical protein